MRIKNRYTKATVLVLVSYNYLYTSKYFYPMRYINYTTSYKYIVDSTITIYIVLYYNCSKYFINFNYISPRDA
jgi:hypothetical protein